MHPDIEWVNPPDPIETGTRRGRSGFQEAESGFGRAYSSIEIEVERQVEVGDAVGMIADDFGGRLQLRRDPLVSALAPLHRARTLPAQLACTWCESIR
jgi:hypothetical protein